MMTGIKYGLAFVWGVMYAGSAWVLTCNRDNEWAIIPLLFLVASSIAVVWLVLLFLVDHWDEV